LAVPRKVRFDKGDTLFTSDAKCKQVYTSLYVFKKEMRVANRGEELMNKRLNDLWRVASPATKQDAEHKSLQLVLRGPHLVAELPKVLKLRRGRITWRTLTAQIAGGALEVAPFCPVTVRNFVMSLPDSEYTKTSLHPKLDAQAAQISLDVRILDFVDYF
jgi:hypothetical protein